MASGRGASAAQRASTAGGSAASRGYSTAAPRIGGAGGQIYNAPASGMDAVLGESSSHGTDPNSAIAKLAASRGIVIRPDGVAKNANGQWDATLYKQLAAQAGGQNASSSLTAAQRGLARAKAVSASGGKLSPEGQKILANAHQKATALTQSGNVVQAFLEYQKGRKALSPEDQFTFDNVLKSNVDGPADKAEGFINTLAGLKDAKDLADLSKVQSDETYFLNKATGTQDQTTGEELRKQWMTTFADKGGGPEYGQGTGTYRAFANEAEGERNRIVGQAATESQARIDKATADYNYNRSVSDTTQQKDIASEEANRTAGRAATLSYMLGVSAQRNNLNQESTVNQPYIPSSGQSSFYGPTNGNGYTSPRIY